MSSALNISIPLTLKQRAMVESKARILWLGTATKTGKTTSLTAWVITGLLNGEATAWAGPWHQRNRSAFDLMKQFLAPLIDAGEVKCLEGGTFSIRAAGGGSIDFYTGENFSALCGGNFSRVVIDEASRHPEGVFAAALTTISATNGRIRLAFNLELGARNWAIKGLLRVQAMTPGQRVAASEDFLTFSAADAGLVDPSLVALMRNQMPEQLWNALYLGIVPDSDSSLFRNLDRIFTGVELAAPLPGHRYIAGIDLGRKQDFTVVTVADVDTGQVVAMDRFSEISWTLQVVRAATLCKRFGCSSIQADATGLGDVVVEELTKQGLEVEAFLFSAPSRKALLEELIVACDNVAITLPASESFAVYKREMELFECVLDGTSVKYAAPSSSHDDTVMSLALCVHGIKKATSLVAGFLDWAKQHGAATLTAFLTPVRNVIQFPRNLKAEFARVWREGQQCIEEDRAELAVPAENACPMCKNSVHVQRINDFLRCQRDGTQFGYLHSPGLVVMPAPAQSDPRVCPQCGGQMREAMAGTMPVCSACGWSRPLTVNLAQATGARWIH